MFDLLRVDDFLESALREEILVELRSANTEAATVYGSGSGAAVQPRVRSARRIDVSPVLRNLVTDRLLQSRPEIAKFFAVDLGECEEPQFLRYEVGDFFVAHQDGNTSMLRDESMLRRISIVLFLNAGYGGGTLTFHGRYPDYNLRHPVLGDPGTLIAFRSETTHEVTPLTHGERYTIVSWFRSDAR